MQTPTTQAVMANKHIANCRCKQANRHCKQASTQADKPPHFMLASDDDATLT